MYYGKFENRELEFGTLLGLQETHFNTAIKKLVPMATHYKVNFCYPFIDHVIQHLNERFPEA